MILKIELLKSDIEQKAGRSMKSPIDFKWLSDEIEKQTKEQISISTLKRLWGYSTYNHTVRYSTLSILARFVAYSDWTNYCDQKTNESSFYSSTIIHSSDLVIDAKIIISWNPDREYFLRHIGSSYFIVEKSKNSTIRINDRFRFEQFVLGQPLIITELDQAIKTSNRKIYIVGSRNGLTKCSILTKQ